MGKMVGWDTDTEICVKMGKNDWMGHRHRLWGVHCGEELLELSVEPKIGAIAGVAEIWYLD